MPARSRLSWRRARNRGRFQDSYRRSAARPAGHWRIACCRMPPSSPKARRPTARSSRARRWCRSRPTRPRLTPSWRGGTCSARPARATAATSSAARRGAELDAEIDGIGHRRHRCAAEGAARRAGARRRYVLGLDLDMRVAAPEEDAVGQDLLDGPAVDLLPLADALDMQRLAVLDQGMAFLGREDGANQGEAGVARVGGTGRVPRRPARL